MTDASPTPPAVLVGGVSELFQSDLDLGRHAVERLRREDLGPRVTVEELHYGAVAVTQRLEDLRPAALVLVGAVRRGRAPGTVVRRRIEPPQLEPAQVQAAVAEAVTGYVGIDLIVEVASGFGLLPPRTIAVEVEPERLGFGEGLSAAATAGLERALEVARAEVLHSPMLELADELRARLVHSDGEPAPASDSMSALLTSLARFDDGGGWGSTFALRDRLRHDIGAGLTREGMSGLDWGLWWGLIEELDRLQRHDAAAAYEPPDGTAQ